LLRLSFFSLELKLNKPTIVDVYKKSFFP